MNTSNLLEGLPAEIVLRILEFCPISTIAKLTGLTRSWHDFIDSIHQDTIFSSHSKTSHPREYHDLSFLDNAQSFSKYFDGTTSWKDLCRRQTLLDRNWNQKEPITRESVIQIGNDAIWRFRADFKRRLLLSTSQQGGFNVTDMDTGNLLWSLPNCQVRPFAHLEYDDGTAVWDREGNAIEVWKTGVDDLPRGAFQRVAILPHDCQTRGFQLSHDTLCVVSTQGQAFVYDMSHDPPQLETHLEIEQDAVGHLYQDAEVVVFSMAHKGYHIYEKASGAFLGCMDPSKCKTVCSIQHPAEPPNSIISTGDALSSLPSVGVFPPRGPTKDRLVPIEVADGPLALSPNANQIKLSADEWGAGILAGSLMVGISRGGRVFICSDWRSAIQDTKKLENNSCLVECESDGSSFDFGGWLSVRDNRIMFEIQDRVYVVALDTDSDLRTTNPFSRRPSYSFATSSATQLAVPISFMALFDDCIMTTYTTLGWHRRSGRTAALAEQPPRNRFRIFPTKTIRILSLAPSLEDSDNEDNGSGTRPQRARGVDTPTNILDIMDMLSDEEGEDTSSEEDEADTTASRRFEDYSE